MTNFKIIATLALFLCVTPTVSNAACWYDCAVKVRDNASGKEQTGKIRYTDAFGAGSFKAEPAIKLGSEEFDVEMGQDSHTKDNPGQRGVIAMATRVKDDKSLFTSFYTDHPETIPAKFRMEAAGGEFSVTYECSCGIEIK